MERVKQHFASRYIGGICNMMDITLHYHIMTVSEWRKIENDGDP